MAVLIDAQDLHKAYSGKVLLSGVDLAINDRMKVGLVGVNGAGKTTLLRLLLGDEEADSGTVHTHNELRLGHLPQHDPFSAEETVANFMQRWSEREPWTCAALAARFGIGPELLDTPLGTISGGWRTRTKLCAVLLREPNLLILDEPTNFLDLRTQLLLERFLASWNGASLVISHDRPFLQATCNHTAELVNGRLRLHPGPIEEALVAWREEEERQTRQAASLASKARQLQRFVDSNRANANTASQARSKAKQIARLNEAMPDLPSITGPRAQVRVPQVERRSGPACHIEDLAIGYGETVVATCHHLEIQRGERLALMGDNGQGKTTLLRTLCGSLPTLRGSVRWTHGAEIALYAQHVYASLGSSGTVHDHLSTCAAGIASTQAVLDIAGSFLFRGDEVHKPLAVCSGGERARAVLAGILLTRATVLVLDEPTNHLDVSTVDSLCAALRNYGGTVLLASHDRRFVESLCTGIIEVGNGDIQRWPGEPRDYCQHLLGNLGASEQQTRSTPPRSSTKPTLPAQAHRQMRKQLAACERKLSRLQASVAELEAAMAENGDPGQSAHIHEQWQAQRIALEACEEEWLTLQDHLGD